MKKPKFKKFNAKKMKRKRLTPLERKCRERKEMTRLGDL
jgi:hypothetical protein